MKYAFIDYENLNNLDGLNLAEYKRIFLFTGSTTKSINLSESFTDEISITLITVKAIAKNNVDKTVKSITFFVNYKKDDIILFDESLGVGATFGSGEETDYVLTLLHKGYKGRYFANDIIFHPAKKGNYSDLERAYKYALGFGALVKKEVKGRKNRFYILKYWKRQFRSFVGTIITKNKKYHKVVMKGRKVGYTKYKI